jgi:hypothetical protein
MANKPYPFAPKDSSLAGLKTISKSVYSTSLYGDNLSGSEYPYSSSVGVDFLIQNHNNIRVSALKNSLDYYKLYSNHYSFSSSYGDKSKQEMKLLSIPTTFYGSSIRKGSVSCKWFVTGTLIAELQDSKRNGELIQVGPSGSNGSGSVAGVVMYNEGFVLLTGSWSLHPTYTDLFGIDLTYYSPSWKYFFNTGSDAAHRTPSSSFDLQFEGVNYIQTVTMLAQAEKGELNHSNNPTYVKYPSTGSYVSGTTFFLENANKQIKNILKTEYSEVDPKLEKVTYISQIGIYDEKKNLIAVAKLANPVRKRQSDTYTFKMKLDI